MKAMKENKPPTLLCSKRQQQNKQNKQTNIPTNKQTNIIYITFCTYGPKSVNDSLFSIACPMCL